MPSDISPLNTFNINYCSLDKTIEITNLQNTLTFTLYSVSGQKLIDYALSDCQKIDLNKFPSGTYVVIVSDKNRQFVRKINFQNFFSLVVFFFLITFEQLFNNVIYETGFIYPFFYCGSCHFTCLIIWSKYLYISQTSPALCFGDEECVDIVFSDLDNSLSYDLVIKRDIGGFFIDEGFEGDFNNDPNFNVGSSLFNYCFPVEGDYTLCLELDGVEIATSTVYGTNNIQQTLT